MELFIFQTLKQVFLSNVGRAGLCFFSGFFLTIFLGKVFIQFLLKKKIRDTPDKAFCEKLSLLHQDKKNTPTMGGVFIAGVLIIISLFYLDLTQRVSWILIGSVFVWSLLGGYDDLIKQRVGKGHGLTAKKKFLVQILLASLTTTAIFSQASSYDFKTAETERIEEGKEKKAFFSLGMPFSKKKILMDSLAGKVFLFIFAVVTILGSSNAVNLTDGLDGLASGCVAITSLCLAFCAWLVGKPTLIKESFLTVAFSPEIFIFLAGVIGVAIGFLWYNGSPAQVFMGDTGSLMLGGVLGTCSVLLRKEWLLVIAGGIFVLEALSVILQVMFFRWKGKRIFLCAPLHHHFEYRGISENKVVVRFWIVNVILSGMGMLALLCAHGL